MKKKMRKFAEGGSSIDEGTRERARKWMEEGSPEQDTGGKDTPSRKPTPKAEPKAETKSESKAETAEEHKERMDKRAKEQGIERVEPENYIPGPGMLKGLFKNAVRAGEKEVARTVTTKAGKDVPVKQGKPDFSGEAKEGMGVKSVKNKSGKEIPVTKMKSGGSVGSASKRADGCAIRGKTRA